MRIVANGGIYTKETGKRKIYGAAMGNGCDDMDSAVRSVYLDGCCVYKMADFFRLDI